MTTILNAKCENNKVETELDKMIGEIENCQILSQGKAKSEGIVIMSQDDAVYITIPITSLKNILDEVSNLASNVNDLISKITVASLGVPTQGWASPPTLPTALQSVSQAISQLQNKISELKENLQ
ncbi:MAG: hypothetical protein LBF97_06345 [Elusimicrobiota bacterium]|jgi:hypothetical protein|nr:hypothetical protein [Elusimicrobiota bacterium]